MNRSSQKQKRRICFVTGTRAEFGLMQTTLRAIQSHPKLKLRIIATGMHLDPAHGKPLSAIRDAGFKPTETVRWHPEASSSPAFYTLVTGMAVGSLGIMFNKLRPDIVMVVGDRVEAFAAAATAHLWRIPVAHIHGGDRALGQIDDSLRHAITKLSHIHFPATEQSADRIRKLGEDTWRIKRVGSPGIDNITRNLAPWSAVLKNLPGLKPRRYALVLMHPTTPKAQIEMNSARMISLAIAEVEFDAIIYVYPNNDPGSEGIIQYLDSLEGHLDNQYAVAFYRDIPRPLFLTYLKNAAVLVGNSSSGIIEAASFGTPVINIGDRQKGRERNNNVIDVPASATAIRRALKKAWNHGRPIRFPKHNIYGSGRTSQKIAHILATIPLDERLRHKLIAY
jgi:UDP-hydrolysing UDP-N-acetyl-D-glucosamine 2-epimerase